MSKIRICFICLGNVCRSPMAELILKEKIKKYNIKNIEVSSRGVSYEEQGNPIYFKAQDILVKHNIELTPHRARRLEKEDLKKFDYFLCMEESHVRKARQVLGEKANIKRLLDHDIEDPWYSDDFEKAFQEIDSGCEKLIKEIL